MSDPTYFAWELSALGRQMSAKTVHAALSTIARDSRIHVAAELGMVFAPIDTRARIATSQVVRKQCRAPGGAVVKLTAAEVERLCRPARPADSAVRIGAVVTPSAGPLRDLPGRVSRVTVRRVRLRLDLLSLRYAWTDRSHLAEAQ